MERHSYTEHVDAGYEDVHFIVHPLEKGTPKRGVTVSIGDQAEIRFNIMIKTHKDSMIFDIERGHGLSQKLAGILGQTMHGATQYHVNQDDMIEVNGRSVRNTANFKFYFVPRIRLKVGMRPRY